MTAWREKDGDDLVDGVLQCSDVVTYVDSFGGTGRIGDRFVALAKMLTTCGARTRAYVGLSAISAGGNILNGSDHITAADDAVVLWHARMGNYEGKVSAKEVAIYKRTMAKLIKHRITHRKDEFRARLDAALSAPDNPRGELSMKARELKEYGYIHATRPSPKDVLNDLGAALPGGSPGSGPVAGMLEQSVALADFEERVLREHGLYVSAWVEPGTGKVCCEYGSKFDLTEPTDVELDAVKPAIEAILRSYSF